MLLQSDTQLGRQSYYEASVLREPPLPPLQEAVEADVLVVGAGFAGLSAALELAERGLRVVRAGGRPHLQRRVRAQRRAGHRRLCQRPRAVRAAAGQCGGAPGLGHVARSHRPDRRAHRPARHRLRLGERLCDRGRFSAQGAGAGGRGRGAGARLRLSLRTGHRGRRGPFHRQPALLRRRFRGHLGPSASAEIRAGAGPSRARAGRADFRKLSRHVAQARPSGRGRHRAGQGARTFCRAGGQLHAG